MTHPDLRRAPAWYAVSDAAGLISPAGQVRQTVFAEMTALAARHGAVNLGQGAPSMPAPEALIDYAAQAMRDGFNQYAPANGRPELREAIAKERSQRYGHRVTPDEVLEAVGATEGITAAVLALTAPGSSVVTFEPFYDSYAAAAELAGASLTTVPLVHDGDTFAPDWGAFERAMGAGSVSAVIVNSPHNPTGMVLGREDLLRIYQAAVAADAWIITDEVYEYLVFEPHEHISLAAIVPDADRVVTVSSAGKAFNVTGWKIGWVIARPDVLVAIQAIKQYLSYANGHPLQLAVAQGLDRHTDFFAANREVLARNRDVLLNALRQIPGVKVSAPGAGYFTIADFSEVTDDDAYAFNEHLSENFGFTGVPVAALCQQDSPAAEIFRRAIRYSYCKSPEEMRTAAANIERCARSFGA